MANQKIKTADLEGVLSISVPRAARLHDMTKNTMRKILREANVLIERGKIHRVLCDDLDRVMQPIKARSSVVPPESEPVKITDADRAAFIRASRGTRRR